MEVLDVDVFVRSRFPLAPEEKTFFGRCVFNGNVLDSESENNSPDHTESHFCVTVDDFFGTDGDQFHAF